MHALLFRFLSVQKCKLCLILLSLRNVPCWLTICALNKTLCKCHGGGITLICHFKTTGSFTKQLLYYMFIKHVFIFTHLGCNIHKQ